MSQTWHLGGQLYQQVSELGSIPGCSWHLVREEGQEGRHLLQIWQPSPPAKALDQLRESYLLRFQDADPLDPFTCRFGSTEDRTWFLQELKGLPLAQAWPELGRGQQESFLQTLREALTRSDCPRFAHPAAAAVLPGRLLLPRILGSSPFGLPHLAGWYPVSGDPEAGPWPLEQPPELAEEPARPIRGRSQELTYLKSLVLGFSAPAPMERIVLLQGEEGLGKDQLTEFCAAVADTEGWWVTSLELQHGERCGSFLDRLFKDLLRGVEADFYAQQPATARALARRFESYAFLRGLNQGSLSSAPLEPDERQAALAALDFAASIHPRVIHVRNLERGDAELAELLCELAMGSRVPWLLAWVQTGMDAALRGALAPLRKDPAVASITLNRLEDGDLVQVLEDLLRPNRLPDTWKTEVARAGLGNSGLLKRILELAQLEGKLVWNDGAWSLASEGDCEVSVHQDLALRILQGRLQRLGPPAAAVLRHLALADHPLELNILGRAMGVAGDPLEQALQQAESARLVTHREGRAWIPDPRVQELALAQASSQEVKRIARSLLKALPEGGAPSLPSVRLLRAAFDPATALARVMEALDRGTPEAMEARRLVEQAMELSPSAAQRSRLWECLSDAMALGGSTAALVMASSGSRAPAEEALEALNLALLAQEEAQAEGEENLQRRARLLRKRTFLELRLRQGARAAQSLAAAAEVLADHPLHPEQPRLRLALARLHILGGFVSKGMKALEEGLQLLGMQGPGMDHRDQVSLLLELGRAQALKAQFQRALSTLQSARRLLEHGQGHARLVRVLNSMGEIHLALGQTEAAHAHFREALHVARLQDDAELEALCHLSFGVFRSSQHHLGPALAHLDAALDRFLHLGDRACAAMARLWKARTLAALGDGVQAEFLMVRALALPKDTFSPGELGEQQFLQAELSGCRGAWREASRLYLTAAEAFATSGQCWRERLCRLKHLQSEACAAQQPGERMRLEAAWGLLEQIKGQVDSSSSRWLEMEWHRAHALLLSDPGAGEALAAEALLAWGEVLAAAREMRFPAAALEANQRCAALLVRRGEPLGARSHTQDAFASFLELWARIPESQETAFVGRPDMHAFRSSVESAGLRWSLPERATSSPEDWTPTNLSLSITHPARRL